jgi:hypothetical protein
MERTNYVAKAKNLMMSTVRTTALVIVPLAAAVNAHAGSVALPTGNYGCSTVQDGNNGTCNGADFQESNLGSGVQGIAFYSNGPISFALSSGGTSQITVTMSDWGTTSGTIPAGTQIPVDALFDLTASTDSSIGSWTLTFMLGTAIGNDFYGSASGSGAVGGNSLTISSTLDVSPDIPAGTLYETAQLTFSATGSESEEHASASVDVPNVNTWTFDSVAATTAVPEPASLGMIASGLAMIGAWIRRRKR